MLFTTTNDHEKFRAQVRGFAEAKIKPIAFMLDKENKFPDEEVAGKMGKLGWLGIPYPKEYGGMGLDYMTTPLLLKNWPESTAVPA